VFQYHSWCVYFVRTSKAKQRVSTHNAGQQGFGFVETDDSIEVTPTRQNCDQTQLKVLNIKSNIFVNMDVFNRTFVMQFPNVALDYDVDWNRYCRTRKFYCELSFLETYLHSVENTYIFYVGQKFTDCFVFHVGTLHYQSNYVLCGYSVGQRIYKLNVFIYLMAFVV